MKVKPTAWTLKAFKYYYIPAAPFGVAGIVVEPTDDLHRLQDKLITAITPYTAKTGTPAAFFSDEDGRDIQEELVEYVSSFTMIAAGKHSIPTSPSGSDYEEISTLTRCWRSHSQRSCSLRRAHRSISLAPLVSPGR